MTEPGADADARARVLAYLRTRAASLDAPRLRARIRAAAAEFDAAVFTNLSRDHFDFHGDVESYFAAKARLFDRLRPGGRAVVNLDDPYGRRLAAAPLVHSQLDRDRSGLV